VPAAATILEVLGVVKEVQNIKLQHKNPIKDQWLESS
jgi:hypothetical protein